MRIHFIDAIFDEPTAVEPSKKPKRSKIAPTFVIDATLSLLFIQSIATDWQRLIALSLLKALPTFLLLIPICVCYISKVLIVRYLEKHGGDARTYVKSGELVTDGPYAWSRHPVYAVAFVQFCLWGLLALYLQAWQPWNLQLLAAAFGLPLAFFLINDIIVMPAEERCLRNLKAEAFQAYAKQTRRWFGRVRQAPQIFSASS